MRLLWVRARAFVHATEDEARVGDAILWLLGRLGDEQAAHIVERKRLKGHYGNDIVLLEATLKGTREVERSVAGAIRSPAVRTSLGAAIRRSLDEDGVLHVRFDKQAAVRREHVLTEGSDAIVLRTKGATFPGENVLEQWEQFLAVPAGPSGDARPPRGSAHATP